MAVGHMEGAPWVDVCPATGDLERLVLDLEDIQHLFRCLIEDRDERGELVELVQVLLGLPVSGPA